MKEGGQKKGTDGRREWYILWTKNSFWILGNKNKRIKSVELAKGKESEKEKNKTKGGGE